MTITASTAVYRPYIDGMPGLVAIRVPEHLRGSDLPMGVTYVIFETAGELDQLMRDLADLSRPLNERLFAWHLRPSLHATNAIGMLLMQPPAEGFPYFLLTRWSGDLCALMLADDPSALNRGRYTVEAYASEAEANEGAAGFLEQLLLQGHHCTFLTPEMVSTGVDGIH